MWFISFAQLTDVQLFLKSEKHVASIIALGVFWRCDLSLFSGHQARLFTRDDFAMSIRVFGRAMASISVPVRTFSLLWRIKCEGSSSWIVQKRMICKSSPSLIVFALNFGHSLIELAKFASLSLIGWEFAFLCKCPPPFQTVQRIILIYLHAWMLSTQLYASLLMLIVEMDGELSDSKRPNTVSAGSDREDASR